MGELFFDPWPTEGSRRSVRLWLAKTLGKNGRSETSRGDIQALGTTLEPHWTRPTRFDRNRFVARLSRDAYLERNRKIADVVARHDPGWSNRPSIWKREAVLTQICKDLDESKIDVPSSWREGLTPSLFRVGLDLRGWSDALDLGFKNLVKAQIQRCLSSVIEVPRAFAASISA
jgi:hypothetical protein